MCAYIFGDEKVLKPRRIKFVTYNQDPTVYLINYLLNDFVRLPNSRLTSLISNFPETFPKPADVVADESALGIRVGGVLRRMPLA